MKKQGEEEYQEKEIDAWIKIKSKSTLDLLTMLEDKDEATRYASARELHMRGGVDVFERTAELCKSKNIENRTIASFVLGQLGVKNGHPFKDKSVPLLENLLLNDPSSKVRAAAISALGFLKATSAFNNVIKMVADPDPHVRLGVAFTLGLLGIQEGKIALDILTQDEDDDVADMAKGSIETFNK